MSENIKFTVTADTSGATSEIEKLNQKMQELEKKTGGESKDGLGGSLKRLGSTLNNIGKSMSELGSKMTVGITLPIVAVSKKMLETGSSMTAFEAKYSQVFKGLSKTATQFSKTMGTSVGVDPTIIRQTLTDFQAYSQGMGMTGKEALTFSEKMTRLTTDISAFSDVPIDDATDRMKSALQGNFEAVDKLGLSFGEATIKQEMLREGLKGQYSDLSETTKMSLLYNLAMYQSKDAQGQAAKEADSYQNKLQNIKTQLAETATQLFTLLLPTLTKVMEKISEGIKWFNGLSESTKKLIIVVAGVLAVAGPILFYIGMLASGIGAIITAVSVAIPIIAAIGAVLFSWVGLFIVIGAAIALFVIYVVKHWDEVKAKTAAIWQAVKDKVGNAVDGIKDKFKAGVDKIKDTINNMKTAWNNGVSSIKATASSIWTAITSPFKSAWSTISGIFSKIKSGFQSAFSFQLPHIKLPHFNISGKLSLNPPSIPTVGINWYAKGGEFKGNNPTVIGVGEGKDSEAVFPLNDSTFGKMAKGITDFWASKNTSSDNDGGNTRKVIIQGNNFVIREEADIAKVSKQLLKLQEKKERNRGGLNFNGI
ncbi:hypothetical protein [Clostridium tyrobutyricum]|uniref:hypothetical protein n=1 Tax=Clostridium tyrobutyricum TaxID=1519 RepID=UPI001C38E452|nr:hypothetical protein [Clostridium tyrobutyricum]MBV4429079.1 hypothetical protein [Clostridium tyrobutyricum]MBV4444156.1 hypothetical protein [Clostridium tyrobutyricum]